MSAASWPFLLASAADFYALDDRARGMVEYAVAKAIREAAMDMLRQSRSCSQGPAERKPRRSAGHLKLVPMKVAGSKS